MTKEDFRHIYHDVKSSTLSIMYKKGSKSVYKKNNVYEIDDKFLIRRRDFYTKIWNISHDNYFKITEHITELKLAMIINKYYKRSVDIWNMFMRTTLFSIQYQENSLFNYKINYNLWVFFRITTFIIRRLER